MPGAPEPTWLESVPAWIVAIFAVIGATAGAIWRGGTRGHTLENHEARLTKLELDTVSRDDIKEVKEMLREVRQRVDRIIDAQHPSGWAASWPTPKD